MTARHGSIRRATVWSPTLGARKPLERRGSRMSALHVDVARGDEVLKQSRFFRATMMANGIPLTYLESDGAPTWTNYRASLPMALRFLEEQMVR